MSQYCCNVTYDVTPNVLAVWVGRARVEDLTSRSAQVPDVIVGYPFSRRGRVTGPRGRCWTTSPRKRSPGVPPGCGHLAGQSRGRGPSPVPRSGAERCRGASPGSDLCPTAGEKRDYARRNWNFQGGREDRTVPHLDGDVGIGVPPVKDGPEVEFGVSLGSEDL